eukprot:11168507-Alexandrium_andersonii.AAC.1
MVWLKRLGMQGTPCHTGSSCSQMMQSIAPHRTSASGLAACTGRRKHSKNLGVWDSANMWSH